MVTTVAIVGFADLAATELAALLATAGLASTLISGPQDIVTADIMLSNWPFGNHPAVNSGGLWLPTAVPTIVVTPRTLQQDKLRAFELGVHDYVTMPYSGRELIARINAVVRRYPRTSPRSPVGDVVQVGSLRMDLDRHSFHIDGVAVELSAREFALLRELMRQPGRVLAYQHFQQHLWEGTLPVNLRRAVNTHVNQVRRKIDSSAQQSWIETIRAVGYRLTL